MTRTTAEPTITAMRYIDSGTREPSQALGHWMEEVLRFDDVVAMRWQTGFFAAGGLGFLAPTLERIRDQGGLIAGLLGSNDGRTLRDDVAPLLALLGIPRDQARLGIVAFAGAFFHPKTYHMTRSDGSQVAYVGSANMTSAGVGSLHVESGLVLDTREHDDPAVLASIRNAVDAWFEFRWNGLTVVDGPQVLDRLLEEGVLALAQVPRRKTEAEGGAANNRAFRARLTPLIHPPRWSTEHVVPHGEDDAAAGDVAHDDAVDDDAEEADELRATSGSFEWDAVWRSKGLSERDLNIPSGSNTNRTGSIGMKKGDWKDAIDHRHYFREEVFEGLSWSQDPRKSSRELATAVFEVWIDGHLAGETALTISHNKETASKTYLQKNEMTHLRWGEAKEWVAQASLLEAVMHLDRERDPTGAPRFRIRIDRP